MPILSVTNARIRPEVMRSGGAARCILAIALMVLAAQVANWSLAAGGEGPAANGTGGEARRERAAAFAGFRAAAADVCWVRAYVAWERQDAASTRGWLRAAVRANPDALRYWLQGARILAFDLPTWRSDTGPNSKAAADEAAAWLADARRRRPDASILWVEDAMIALQARGDVAAAARSLQAAIALPNSPAYAPRLLAELLRRLDRNAEAYALLRALHLELTQQEARQRDPAIAAHVLARIRDLERDLEVPANQVYRVPSAPPGSTATEDPR